MISQSNIRHDLHSDRADYVLAKVRKEAHAWLNRICP